MSTPIIPKIIDPTDVPVNAATFVPKPSRMDLLGRRDQSRWGGLSDLEQEQLEKKRAALARRAQSTDPSVVSGAPLEFGNAAVGGILQQQMMALQNAENKYLRPQHTESEEHGAASISVSSEATRRADALKLLKRVHRYLLGLAGIAPAKPKVWKEGDPPLPPPPAPVLAIDTSIMQSKIGSVKELAPELLVHAAEVGATLSEWETVWSCLSLFAATNPALSQYQIRAMIVQARAQAIQSVGKKGKAFSDDVLAGVNILSSALQLILAKPEATLPSYNFLLYNIASTLLFIVRPLLRQGFRTLVTDALIAISTALETHIALEHQEKNPRIEIELCKQIAICLEEKGDLEAASKFLAKGWLLLTKKYTLAPLSYRQAYVILMVHVNRDNPKAIESLTNDIDVLSRAIRQPFIPGFKPLIALQRIRSGIVAPDDREQIEEILKSQIELLADNNYEAFYLEEGAEDPSATGANKRKKAAASAPAKDGPLSPAGGASGSTKKRTAKASAKEEELTGANVLSPKEAALLEVQKQQAAEAQRKADRLKRKYAQELASQRMEVMAQLGLECYKQQFLPLAQRACNAAIVSKRNGLWPAWIVAELLSVQLDIKKEESKIYNADANRIANDANSGTEGFGAFIKSHRTNPNKNTNDAPSSSTMYPYGSQSYTARIHGLKILDQTLTSASRLIESNPDLVENLIREIWNLLHPLLQRNLMGFIPIIPKLLKCCTLYLGEGYLNSTSSDLLEIRVLAHYEIALWEAGNDYLSKAIAEMEKAILLDYTYPAGKMYSPAIVESFQAALKDDSQESATAPIHSQTPMEIKRRAWEIYQNKEQPFIHALRPYDLELFQPFLHKLRIQTIMYDEPLWFVDSKEDQALRWIEQAKEIKVAQLGNGAILMKQNPYVMSQHVGHQQNHMKRNLLMKAIELLDTPIFTALNSSAGVHAHVPGTSLSASGSELFAWTLEVRCKRATCWTEIAKVSFEQGFLDLLFVSVAHVTELTWYSAQGASTSNNSSAAPWDKERHSQLLLQQSQCLMLQARAAEHVIRTKYQFQPGLIFPATTRPSTENDGAASGAAASGFSTTTTPAKGKEDSKDSAKGSNKKKKGSEKEKEEARKKEEEAKAALAAAEAAAASDAATAIVVEEQDAEDPLEVARREEAAFYEHLFHNSIVQLLHLSSYFLTGERFSYLVWNTAVTFYNAFQQLFYNILHEHADSTLTWQHIPTAAETARGIPDIKLLLSRVWEHVLAACRAPGPQGHLRKPGLVVQLATVLSRILENERTPSATEQAVQVITTVLQLIQPVSGVNHANHPAFEPLKRKALFEIYARLTLRKVTATVTSGTAFTSTEKGSKSSSGGSGSSGAYGEFNAAVASLSNEPESQLFMLLELLRSTSNNISTDERRTRLHECIAIMSELSDSIQTKLQISLPAFNGEIPVGGGDDRPSSSRAGRGQSRSSKKPSSSSSQTRRGSAKKKRTSTAGEEEVVARIPDPYDPAKVMNAQTYAVYQLALRELETTLWCEVCQAAFELQESLLTIQSCYFGLQSLPGYNGPKLDLPQGIMMDHSATRGGSKASSKKPPRKTSIGGGAADKNEESKEERESSRGRTASPRSRPMSPSSVITASSEKVYESLSNVSSSRLRAYAHMSLLYGASIVSLIDPTRHDQPSQDQIRRAACDFFTRSTQYAADAIAKHIKDAAVMKATPHLFLKSSMPTFEIDSAATLMLQASQRFWNAALPMTYESLTRTLLIPFLGRILANLENVIEALSAGGKAESAAAVHALDPPFRCALYTLYFDALTDAKEWQLGYSSSSQALKTLPASERKLIWSNRILFMSKLGLDVGVAILKMKDAARHKQAKIWRNLARHVENNKFTVSQKYDFYIKAIDVLEENVLAATHSASASGKASQADAAASAEEEALVESVEILLEFSEFLYSNNFPLTDCQDQLLLAADKLLSREEGRSSASEQQDVAGSDARSRMGRTMSRTGSISGSHSRTRSRSQSPGSISPSRRQNSLSMTGNRFSATGGSNSAAGSGNVSGSATPSMSGTRSPVTLTGTLRSSIEGSTRVSARTLSKSADLTEPRAGQPLTLRHLLLLIRIYSMLGCTSQRVSEKERMALVVSHFIQRAWECMMRAVEEGFFGRPILPEPRHPSAADANGSVTGTMTAVPKSTTGSMAPSLAASKHASLTAAGAASLASHVSASLHGKRSSLTLTAGVGSMQTTPVAAPAAATTPYVALPRTPEEWLNFALPASIRSWLTEQGTSAATASGPYQGRWGDHVLHDKCLSRDESVLLLHYLSIETLPTLNHGGFHLQTLPLLYLLELIAAPDGCLLRSRCYQSLVFLRTASTFDALHQPSLSNAYLSRAEPILPTPEESLQLKNLVEKREQLHRVKQEQRDKEAAGEDLYDNDDSSSTYLTTRFNALQVGSVTGRSDAPSTAGRSDLGATVAMSRPDTANSSITAVSSASNMYSDDVLQTTETILAALSQYQPSPQVIIGPDLNPRSMWNEMAQLLIARGRFPLVKQLLNEYVMRFCLAWQEDLSNASQLYHHLSKIALYEGAPQQALSLEKYAQQIYFGRADEWTGALLRYVEVLQSQADKLSTPLSVKLALDSKSKSILMHAIACYTRLLADESNRSSFFDLKRGVAACYHTYATMLEKQEKRGWRAFGDEFSHNPSSLPVSFSSAAEVAPLDANNADNAAAPILESKQQDSSASPPPVTGSRGVSRAGSNYSFTLGSAAPSQAGLALSRSNSAALLSFKERTTPPAEQQQLYDQLWAVYEKLLVIEGGVESDPATIEFQAAMATDQFAKLRTATPDAHQPLQDASALSQTLIAYSQSLIRYAGLFAFPAAEAGLASTASADGVLLAQMLAKVTAGTRALHQALLLLSRAESILSSQLLLASASSVAAQISLPLQRTLHQVKTCMANAYLLLFKFKKPRRRYDAPVKSDKVVEKADVLRLDSLAPSSLSFAPDTHRDASEIEDSSARLSSNALERDIAAQEELFTRQEAMNTLFFEKYSATFSDEASDARALIHAGPQVAWNEKALHLAAAAVNLEGSFAGVLATLAQHTTATNVVSQAHDASGSAPVPSTHIALSLAPTASGTNSSFHTRLLQDSPSSWLTLGLALSAMHQEAVDQAETDREKALQAEMQARAQKEWQSQLNAVQETQALKKMDPRLLAEKRKEQEILAEDAALAAEEAAAQAAYEAEVRAKLIADDEARRKAEAEALEKASGRKKKKSSRSAKDGSTSASPSPTPRGESASGERPTHARKLSVRETKEARLAAAEKAANDAQAALTARPEWKETYESDHSNWSPAYTQRHVEYAEWAKRQEALRAADDVNTKGKKGAAGGGRTPRTGPVSPSSKKKKLEEVVEAPVPTEPAPIVPALPAVQTLEGQAILSLQRTVELCMRRDYDFNNLAVLSKAALELTDLFGTRHPIHAARYLHLSGAASLKSLAVDAIEYCQPTTGAEALVIQRARLLQAAHEIPGPELEQTRKFLKNYSDAYKLLSTFQNGFFEDRDPAALANEEAKEEGKEEKKEKPSAKDKDKDKQKDKTGDSSAGTAADDASSSTEHKDDDVKLSNQGLPAFLSLLSSLPESVTALTLHFDAQSQSLYASVLTRDSASTMVARSSLSRDDSKEMALLLSQYGTLVQKLQRSLLVYGSLSNCVQLDNLERNYATFLGRLDAFFNRTIFAALQAWSGLFYNRDVVLLISSPQLWSLPLESLSVLKPAASVSRDFSLAVHVSRVVAQQSLPIQAINSQSVGFVVDSAAEDTSILTNPAVVGANAAGMTSNAIQAHEAAQQAALLAAQEAARAAETNSQTMVISSSSRPSSANKLATSPPPKKSKSTAGKSAAPVEGAEIDPLVQSDMSRVVNELKVIASTIAPGASSSSSSKADKDAQKADKELSALLSQLRSTSPGWVGLHGRDHLPVVGEWAKLICQAAAKGGAFLYLGYESFLSRLSLSHVLALPHLNPLPPTAAAMVGSGNSGLPLGAQAFLLFDRGINDVSYRTNSRANNSKSPLDRSVESSFFTALFLSLKGASTIVLRPHSSAGSSNAATAKLVMEAALFEGRSLASATRALHHAQLAFPQRNLPIVPGAYVPQKPVAVDPTSPAAGTGVAAPTPGAPIDNEPVDMIKYLDHAIWSADPVSNDSNSSPRKGGAAAAASKVGSKGKGSAKPLIATHLRNRDAALASPRAAALGSRSPPSSRKKKGAAADVNAAPAAPVAAVPEAAIKLRVYDQWNLISVGLTHMKFQ